MPNLSVSSLSSFSGITTSVLQESAACAFITRDQKLSSSRRLSAQTRYRTRRTKATQQAYSARPGVVRGFRLRTYSNLSVFDFESGNRLSSTRHNTKRAHFQQKLKSMVANGRLDSLHAFLRNGHQTMLTNYSLSHFKESLVRPYVLPCHGSIESIN